MRQISSDKRYNAIPKLNEKKQAFNAYKTQKGKEEKEEERQAAKEAKEKLYEYLTTHPLMNSNMLYRKAHELLESHKEWSVVAERDRKDVFEDSLFFLAKKERKEEVELRAKQKEELAILLEEVKEISYRTTWQDAQEVLASYKAFKNNILFENIDKEDMLIVFMEHIKALELDFEDEKQKRYVKEKRNQRINRDNFIKLLNELHEKKKLDSISNWADLYPVVSKDPRYGVMLGQPGSTPLDLFKFYLEDLKSTMHEDKKSIKDVLKAADFEVEPDTSYERFYSIISNDEKTKSIDKGNIKVHFLNLLEKAEAKEKEAQRAEERRLKRRDTAFRHILKDAAPPITSQDEWAKVKTRFESDVAYEAFGDDDKARLKLFKEYTASLEPESMSDDHSEKHKKRRKKEKKHKHKAKRSPSYDMTGSSDEDRKKKQKKTEAEPSDDEKEEPKKKEKKAKKKSKKKKKEKAANDSGSETEKKKKKPRKNSSGGEAKSDASENESEDDLSESELENRRKKLLEELSKH